MLDNSRVSCFFQLQRGNNNKPATDLVGNTQRSDSWMRGELSWRDRGVNLAADQ
jgi:hypothetical protein